MLILDHQGGFVAIFKALTVLAGRKRDDSRLSIAVSQLKHGLATSKLNIQVGAKEFCDWSFNLTLGHFRFW